jgi:hypothetical protein
MTLDPANGISKTGRRATRAVCQPDQTESQPAVLALLYLLMTRCFDKLEAAAPWLRPARAASATKVAQPVAACPRPGCAARVLPCVSVPVLPPGFSPPL